MCPAKLNGGNIIGDNINPAAPETIYPIYKIGIQTTAIHPPNNPRNT